VTGAAQDGCKSYWPTRRAASYLPSAGSLRIMVARLPEWITSRGPRRRARPARWASCVAGAIVHFLLDAFTSRRTTGTVSGRLAFRRCATGRCVPSESLGWAEVRHPFHPLRGQRFPVLKTRRVGVTETLILREPTRGSIAVCREWTDWDPGMGCGSATSQRFAFESLIELAKLVDDLSHPAPSEIDR